MRRCRTRRIVRRLDLHASLRDPFGAWQVRLHSERKAIPVALVADLSASMGFEGAQRKLDVLADLADSLAWSAWRTGDSFGFVGCDEQVRADRASPRRAAAAPGWRSRSAAHAAADRAFGARAARSAPPPAEPACAGLPGLRLSPAAGQIDTVLDSLALHEVVPVVLWQPVNLPSARRAAWRRCGSRRAANAMAVVAAGVARALERGAGAATRCAAMQLSAPPPEALVHRGFV